MSKDEYLNIVFDYLINRLKIEKKMLEAEKTI